MNIKENITEIIATLCIAGSLLFLTSLLFVKIPHENKELVISLSNLIVGSSIGAVLGYYFGQSKKRDPIVPDPTKPKEDVPVEKVENEELK